MRQAPLLGSLLGIIGFVLAVLPPALAQQSDIPMWRGQPVPDVMPRHRIVIREGVPKSFADVTAPPLPAGAIEYGRSLYFEHCAACHGENGGGTSPGVIGTDQYPGDLDRLVDTAFGKSDPYMYWTITHGGELVGSNMPAFESALSEREIWAVIAFLRNAFRDG